MDTDENCKMNRMDFPRTTLMLPSDVIQMMRLVMVILIFVFGLLDSQAQEVISVSWPTKNASPPASLAKPASDFLPAFRIALSVLPESNIVSLVMSQPYFIGLSQQDADHLQGLFSERYQKISADPVFRSAASMLPYCYSEETPTTGLALVYRPKQIDTNTPCLIFLHGYGGSFLWSQQLLAESFPNYIIICPAYGISSAFMPPAYLSECVKAVELQVGCKVIKPTLMGLSAGGFAASRIYVESTNSFSRLVILAAYPPGETLGKFNSTTSAYFLVGANESYVQSGQFGNCIHSLRDHKVKTLFRALSDADHFFLLAQREETLKILHGWLDEPASK